MNSKRILFAPVKFVFRKEGTVSLQGVVSLQWKRNIQKTRMSVAFLKISTVVSQFVPETSCSWWSDWQVWIDLCYGVSKQSIRKREAFRSSYSFTACAALHCLILEFAPDSEMVDRRMIQTSIRKVLQVYAPKKVNHNKRLLFGLAVKKAVKMRMMGKSESIKTDTICSNYCQ